MADYDWLVVADDLTGANDTGHQFAAAGFATRVLPSFPGRTRPADVLVVNTDSRTASPDAAAAAVGDAVEAVDARRIYKKIDSTLRGNASAELDALRSKTGASLLLVAPAFPSNGRITVNGTHLVDGSPVDEAESVQERENPPGSSRLSRVFSDVGAPVAELSLETVQAGEEAIATRLAALRTSGDEPVVVLCDATTDAHLERIVAASRRFDPPPVYVGSAGLAGRLAESGAESSREEAVLGVVGSTNAATFAQLDAVPDAAIVSLDIRRALDSPADAGRALATEALSKLRDDGVAVVVSARGRGSVAQAYDYGEERGIRPDAVRGRIETAIETAVDAVRAEISLDGLFVTGGTVATATFRTLGIDDIALGGEAVAEGVPVASATTDAGEELALVTKAGGFGDRETIVDCLRTLGASIDPAGRS